jgi:hypothetical protein
MTVSKLKHFATWDKAAAVLLIVVGIVFRLRQYLTGRSLWVDEAMLALNIVNRNMTALFKPLDYDQGAPLGFLLVEKVFNLLFGRNEYALRLFPLLIGILSLWLFYLLLQHLVQNNVAVLIALALFVFNPRLIYYSSEVKQYILDVCITVMLFLFASPFFEAKAENMDFVQLALAGFVALWFSHPALFVLAGIGLALVILFLQRHDYIGLRQILAVGILWVVTIGLLYLLILQDLQQNAYMMEYWQGAFPPMPPWRDPVWFLKILNENIGLQFGIPYGVYPVFALMVMGWFVLWKDKRNYAVAIMLALLFTLLASSLHLYPVMERMILFTIPFGLLLIGKLLDFLYSRLPSRGSFNILTTILLAGYLIYGPFSTSVGSFFTPKYFEHIRPAMENLQSAWKTGDVMYVSNGAVPAFEFYAPMYGLENVSYRSNSRRSYQYPQEILNELDTLKGQKRVWVLLSHVYQKGEFNEKDFIFEHLKKNGTRKREFRMPGTSVYLYLFDLGK